VSLDGTKNSTSFIVVQGYVVGLGKQSKINSPRSGIYPLKWLKNRLPDGVKVGSYVTIIGQLITLDLGRSFQIIKAEALKPGSLPKFKKFLQEVKHESATTR
jgi:hypothetical protein